MRGGKEYRPRLLMGGDGSHVLVIRGEKVARIRESGIGRFTLTMQDGRELGRYRTRKAAVEALLPMLAQLDAGSRLDVA
jgi:hypothetical protein